MEFQRSYFTTGLTRLQKRLHPQHEKYTKIIDELNRAQAGEFGEQHIYTILQTFPKTEEIYYLHNICIDQVQIDLLAISNSWCIAFEVKNIKGQVRFNTNPRQLIRKLENQQEESFQCPQSQLERILSVLNRFFLRHQIKLPIYPAVVFPFNNAIITPPDSNIPIIIGRDLINFIQKLPVNKPVVNPQKVAGIVEKANEPYHRFPLASYYGIDETAILKGVECSACGQIPMTRLKGSWKCLRCGVTDRHAHVQAILDFYMLLSPTMTNRQCRDFLGLRNRHEATRMLSNISTTREGRTHNSIYFLKI